MTSQASAEAPLLPISAQLQKAASGQSLGRSGCHSWKRAALICLFSFGLIAVAAYGLKTALQSRASQSILQNRASSSLSEYSLNFLVVGDWGRHGLYNQSLVATQMGKVGDELGIQFVISVGDNFYDRGLTGVNDSAFSESFSDIYTASSLQTTWYAVLGNHDYMGDALAQLSDEIAQHDWRWFCRRQFQLSFPLCNGVNSRHNAEACSDSVDMFFFDTTPFIDAYWENSTTKHYDWRGLAPRAEQLQSQLQDLDAKLQASTATWKFVLGHHTIRSIGSHGDMSELKSEVDMYVNGHDHILQHIKRTDSAIHFVTSGGGSKSYAGLRSYDDDDGVQFVHEGQGFLAVCMTATSALLTFYDVYGVALYSYTKDL
ncbi:hypothetical protein GOP47_0009234 [Adiantum capillus-veneris]|uniref:Purple acid phosphatase n=1 Tax=Adiantum capillus-veneris TaxID=13818 RepID=A0A9D4ZH06_ADICA|nr:hypothetical protein GOP47_0009234 [Adiantum capillus-veneris]